jgi:hypothetical protein
MTFSAYQESIARSEFRAGGNTLRHHYPRRLRRVTYRLRRVTHRLRRATYRLRRATRRAQEALHRSRRALRRGRRVLHCRRWDAFWLLLAVQGRREVPVGRLVFLELRQLRP